MVAEAAVVDWKIDQFVYSSDRYRILGWSCPKEKEYVARGRA